MSTIRNYVPEANWPSGATEADVDLAEQLIDIYVGPQTRSFEGEHLVEVTAVDGAVVTDDGSGNHLGFTNGYFSRCILQIVGGTGVGQVRRIETSDKDDRSLTLASAFDPQVVPGSVGKVYQLAKFPRKADEVLTRDGQNVYKTIPDAIQQAVIAQTTYVMAKGADFFTGDSSDFKSETIGNYSYTKNGESSGSNLSSLISPEARAHLRGIRNSGGRLIPENPTCL